ncbi:hypothetical protein [Klebsiella pneumoniae]|uniref:hypothetical protein n=1 Tax=Klebsiella pneumoniae TaxID=573 RepID=UPI0028CF47FF|nr:hypothetical protein [Klebsiella pneumoniae]
MTKSTITRERLDWLSQISCRDDIEDIGGDEIRELASMALAAMDSEPVAWTWHYREQWHVTNDERRAEFVAKDGDVAVLPLYRHAQPAPVVPPEQRWEELCRQHPDMSIGDAIIRAAWWNHCRPAMLQENPVCTCPSGDGSLRWPCPVHPGSSPVIPDGYVMVPKEPTEAMMLHNSGCQHHAWDDPDCAMRQTRRLIWSHMLAAAPQEVK